MPRPEVVPDRPFLGPAAERLQELHHPARTRILLELAADVEELSAELRRRGVPAGEAEQLAAERVIPSEPVLDELIRLHRPFYRRVTAPIPDTALGRLERGILLALTVVILGGGLAALGRYGLLDAPSPFLWPVMGLAGAIVAVTLWRSFQLFVRGEDSPGTLGHGLNALIWLSAATLLVAGVGVVAGLWALAATLEVGAADPGAVLTAWLFCDSVLAVAGLLTALAGGLAWFLLAQSEAAVRGADQEVRRSLGDAAMTGPVGRAIPHTNPPKEATS